jgi:hypothetical protein
MGGTTSPDLIAKVVESEVRDHNHLVEVKRDVERIDDQTIATLKTIPHQYTMAAAKRLVNIAMIEDFFHRIRAAGTAETSHLRARLQDPGVVETNLLRQLVLPVRCSSLRVPREHLPKIRITED